MSIEAMKQALEALETIADEVFSPYDNELGEAIITLRTAIAEAEKQEPVAWLYEDEPWFDDTKWHDQYSAITDEQVARFKDKNCRPLYTTPPAAQREWVGLTDDDEIDWDGGDLKSLVKAIEAKLKEKNT